MDIDSKSFKKLKKVKSKTTVGSTINMKSNVRLIKPKMGKGYFLEVKDKYNKYSWAITEDELLLIYKVTKDEVGSLQKKE